MKIWILYREGLVTKSERYEVDRLLAEAARRGHEAIVLAPEQIDLLVHHQMHPGILVEQKPVDLPDAVLPRMGAATTHFALSVIRQLEMHGVISCNSAEATELAKDKLFSHQILAARGLPIPKTILARWPLDLDLVERELGLPLIIKTLSGSQGSGVLLCESRPALRDLTEFIAATAADRHLLFQEFVAASRGRDLRVLVVGDRVVGAMERRARGDDFKANYSLGGEVRGVIADATACALAVQTASALGLDIAGVDLLYHETGYRICEANSSAGFMGLESCSDADVSAAILDHLEARQLSRLSLHGDVA